MTEIRFNIDDATFKNLSSKKIFDPEARKSKIYESIKLEIISIKHIIRSLTPVFTGTARDNVYDLIYGSPIEMTGTVFTTGIPHWVEIELGRQPGTAPTQEEIQPWVEYKLHDASLWYVIARSIGKHGFVGKFIWQRVATATEANIGKSFAARFSGLF